MKRIELVFLLALLLTVSCSQTSYIKLSIEIPDRPVFDINPYEKVIVADFMVTEAPEDLNINQQIIEYFQSEFKMRLSSEVSHINLSPPDDGAFLSPEFWKNAIPDGSEAVIFTGSAGYQAEVRKAFSSADTRRLETPFPEESRIYQRGFFTLEIDIYLIEASSGEVLFQKAFKETRSYNSEKQRASFALYDLLNGIKTRLLRRISGGSRLQDRYLLPR